MTRLIGLDIGTTGCKAHIFDENGQLLVSASREYAIDMPQPGWADQDAELVWVLAQEALREALSRAGDAEYRALGISAQGEAVIPVDSRGKALRPAILGMDMRNIAQNEWLAGQFGEDYLFDHTGMPVLTVNTLPKLLWIRQNEPQVWEKAWKFLLYEDFLIHKMTGRAVVSRCLASRTQYYDLHHDVYWNEALERIGLSPERLAEIAPSGTPVGPMEAGLAASLGLDARNPPLVVTGGHDQACAALGCGLVRAGLAMDSTGSAEVVEVALATPNLSPALNAGKVSVYRHVVPGLYLAMTLNHSGGVVLRWFRDTFCQDEMQKAALLHTDAYDYIFNNASSAPSPVMLVPHFSGSGTPFFDSHSKGTLVGLTLGTTKADVARAVIEGLTYELRMHVDLLRAAGVQIDELRAVGGGARSELWLRLKADITRTCIVTPALTEAAGLGAAILGGVGAGIFASPAQAIEKVLRFKEEYQPHAGRVSDYARRFEIYKTIYPAVRQISTQL